MAIFSVALAEEFRYDKGARRDPFVPVAASDGFATGGGLDGRSVVEGIVFDPKGGSYAVIGGEIYREGESVKDSKLIRILPDRVIFLQDNEEMVIWLREELVKKQGKGN